jgi:hypothetical protein
MNSKYPASIKVPQPRSEIVGRPVTGPQPINKNPDPYLGPLPPGYDGTHICWAQGKSVKAGLTIEGFGD